MKLYLIRHGETEWNASRRIQGHRDPGLNDLGKQQADAMGAYLAAAPIEKIYASDLKRAAETATVLAAYHPLNVQTDARLRERAFGEWEGLTHEQIQARDGEGYRLWQADRVNQSPPGGEPLGDLRARVADFCKALTGDSNVAIVAHGGSLRVMLCQLLDLPVETYWRFRLQNASISELSLHPTGAVVHRWNDTSHLK